MKKNITDKRHEDIITQTKLGNELAKEDNEIALEANEIAKESNLISHKDAKSNHYIKIATIALLVITLIANCFLTWFDYEEYIGDNQREQREKDRETRDVNRLSLEGRKFINDSTNLKSQISILKTQSEALLQSARIQKSNATPNLYITNFGFNETAGSYNLSFLYNNSGTSLVKIKHHYWLALNGSGHSLLHEKYSLEDEIEVGIGNPSKVQLCFTPVNTPTCNIGLTDISLIDTFYICLYVDYENQPKSKPKYYVWRWDFENDWMNNINQLSPSFPMIRCNGKEKERIIKEAKDFDPLF
jgi:hypothetical protein